MGKKKKYSVNNLIERGISEEWILGGDLIKKLEKYNIEQHLYSIKSPNEALSFFSKKVNLMAIGLNTKPLKGNKEFQDFIHRIFHRKSIDKEVLLQFILKLIDIIELKNWQVIHLLGFIYELDCKIKDKPSYFLLDENNNIKYIEYERNPLKPKGQPPTKAEKKYKALAYVLAALEKTFHIKNLQLGCDFLEIEYNSFYKWREGIDSRGKKNINKFKKWLKGTPNEIILVLNPYLKSFIDYKNGKTFLNMDYFTQFNTLKSAIGYLMHIYKDPSNAKAIIFIDEKLSEAAYGRSGKGVVIKAVSNIRNVVPEDGRNFNISKNFAFQRVKADTNIIAFEDLRDKFPFEKLFSIITEGITIERKNKDEIFLSFSNSPKVVLSTNYSIPGVDDSTTDRQFVVEFSDHYNKHHKPIDDFGKLFFEGWDNSEWQDFFCFMIECLQFYLKNGLMTYDYVNLDRKKLIDMTCNEFAEFGDELNIDTEYDKKDLFEKYKSENEEIDKLQQGKFTRWLKIWAEINDYNYTEKKSGAKRMITFQKRRAG